MIFKGNIKAKIMAKVITFSRVFPADHPKAGQPTYFVEKFLKGRPTTIEKEPWNPEKSLAEQLPFAFDIWDKLTPKYHTIRSGNRWKAGEYFSPRVWGDNINPKTGRKGPYHSNQITIAPDTLIEKVWDVIIFAEPSQSIICLPTESPSLFQMLSLGEVAVNDGLEINDFERWFNPKRKSVEFHGQIICWNSKVEY